MAQWESLSELHSGYSQQLHVLYDRDGLPMDVLLEKLDNQYSRFVLEESFLMQHNIRRYKQNFQCIEHALVLLEELQDEFDFKCETLKMEVMADKAQQNQTLQILINKLNGCRKTMLSDLSKLLERVGELQVVLLQGELAEFTCLARCLFQVLEFLNKLDELMLKLTYEEDPFKIQKPDLQRRTDTLLRNLLKSAFVVETQPSMPQGKGQLVLRTNVQFSVKTRLLVKFPELNHAMKVNVSMDRDMPQVKGSRRFNVLGTDSKALNMAESQNGGMVADFRHLTLKEQKSGGGGKGVSETSSLPVVIISNSSQQQSAWASILWFNMLSPDTKDVLFFANAPGATWPVLGEMLSWQFLSATQRCLDSLQLDMIAHKLFGKQQDNYDTCQLSWVKFCKENSASGNFTFWVWFDGILTLVKTYLENMWRDGESLKDGGITFSWVDYSATNEPVVKSVQPFTKVDLSQIPFHEIIRNFQMMEADNVPENPLLYLYPDTPKDQAFGKYYVDKCGDEDMSLKVVEPRDDPLLSSTGEAAESDLLAFLNSHEDLNYADWVTLDDDDIDQLHHDAL
ncbi:hypothetical protein CRUP_005002, partial [Coryphaenoides rupestris]